MKKLFYIGLIGLLLFEVANVYFIMPMPGSQRMDSIDVAYFLYQWRWVFRCIFVVLILLGLAKANWKRRWTLAVPLLSLGFVVYMTNFVMAADHMFYRPKQVLMANRTDNKIDTNRLVIGVINNGEAKAYPIRFLGYHHQVQDTVGGKVLIITYCTVCRTGRVYEPLVNGKNEQFRLVGMDHFNAMFEDKSTKSWWRQATGEAITGQLKGQQLPEFLSSQTSLGEWLRLNPKSFVMQADPTFVNEYDSTTKYETGKSKSKLTGTDSLSWKDKSWVVGIKSGTETKAFDWNKLKSERIIQDKLGETPIMLVLANDNKSFFAFKRPSEASIFVLKDDILLLNNRHYQINGKGIDTTFALQQLPVSQEFWHSWATFNPTTKRY